MCIFCGGTCGGVGDAILPYATIGISIAVIRIRAIRASRKQKRKEDASKKHPEIKPDYSFS